MSSDPVKNFLDTLPPYITLKKACEVAGCRMSSMYDHLGLEHFRSVKFGGKRLVDTQSLLKYLNSLPTAPVMRPAWARRAEEARAANSQ